MRLALVHRQFGRGGGLEKYLGAFALALAEAGHEILVVTSRVGPDRPEHPRIQLRQLPELPFLRSLRLLKFARDARLAAKSLEVDLVLGFGSSVAQDIHRAGGGCHRVYSEMLPLAKRWSLVNRADLRIEEQIYCGGHTKHFVVNSTKVSQEIQLAYGVDAARISVIHTPVDLARFHPIDPAGPENRPALRSRLVPGTDPNRRAFLFVSLDHRRKGLGILLDVWNAVPAELWIAGPPLSPAQRDLVRSRGLAGRVLELGARSDLHELFRAADFFLHPTLYDACANTVLQSMASGLPGIISSRDGAIDFLEDNRTGFLLRDPEAEGEVLDLIHRAMALPEPERLAMGEAARRKMMPQTWASHLAAWDVLMTRSA